MASATWAVGRRMWGNMKQLRLGKTVMVMAKKMLPHKLHSLLGADEKFDCGAERREMLVKSWDTFLLMVEDIIGAEICSTGGHYTILRYAKSDVGELRHEIQNLWEEDEKSYQQGGQGGEGNLHCEACHEHHRGLRHH
jgi:hypothetical protein